MCVNKDFPLFWSTNYINEIKFLLYSQKSRTNKERTRPVSPTRIWTGAFYLGLPPFYFVWWPLRASAIGLFNQFRYQAHLTSIPLHSFSCFWSFNIKLMIKEIRHANWINYLRNDLSSYMILCWLKLRNKSIPFLGNIRVDFSYYLYHIQ